MNKKNKIKRFLKRNGFTSSLFTVSSVGLQKTITPKSTTLETAKFSHVVYYTPPFTNESDSESKKCNFVYTFSI